MQRTSDDSYVIRKGKIMKFTIPIVVLLSMVLLGLFITKPAEKHATNILPAPDSIEILAEIPDRTIEKSALNYDNRKSLWLIDDKLYSGFALRFYQNGKLKEKIGILNGKKHGKAKRWYSDGHFQEVANYYNGKLHGEKKLWSPDANHVLITHLNYYRGKAHGEQKQWYQTGELFKKLNMKMGREEGIQQAFRKNGDLYANYEAKNGRIFGLKRAELCYGLEDEALNLGNGN